jgi:hypothetical protein
MGTAQRNTFSSPNTSHISQNIWQTLQNYQTKLYENTAIDEVYMVNSKPCQATVLLSGEVDI